eukprot:CAMPEP_0172463716 /NCGR_PEP_ID=MMETSP1065-20121228/48158_1 /TAXON_ID=265537 /ORGANISM="Amphiprora paludosa, Strain CCMP125" /LENGTH=1123 /DNA_ID=CAMNT_0013219733 /DNA_START=144 /DNA_END=3515 /DNA_ORIENTATION=-
MTVLTEIDSTQGNSPTEGNPTSPTSDHGNGNDSIFCSPQHPFPDPPDSPLSRAGKMLGGERGALMLSATLDEDDEENAALYTEVVLSDEEEDYEDMDGAIAGRTPKHERHGSASPRSSRALPRSPMSNRAMRATSLDGYDAVYESFAQTGGGEEEGFRIRHLLNYGDGSQAPPPPPAAGPSLESLPSIGAVGSPPQNSSRTNRQHTDALFVDDKPWRNNRVTVVNGSGFRKGSSGEKDRRGSLLGRFRKRTVGGARGKADSADASNTDIPGGDEENIIAVMEDILAADAGSENGININGPGSSSKPQSASPTGKHDLSASVPNLVLGDHDLVVEAESRPSSDESSFGEGSTQDDWDFDSEDEEKEEGFAWEKPVDWKTLAEYQLPTHYARTSTGLYPRRQSSSSTHDPSINVSTTGAIFSQRRASHFVWQHGMILHAAFQLLVERDHLGVEASMDESNNILKKGPLQKLSNSGRNRGPNKWKVKYVEIRTGNLCYYEDSGQESGRKSIHLRATDTTVGISKVKPNGKQNATASFCFEISQPGAPAWVWMAKSDADRQAWIRALQAAMIGGEDDFYGEGGQNSAEFKRRELDAASYGDAITRYESLRSKLCDIDVLDDYISAVKASTKGNEALQIPVSWIRQQVKDLGKSGPSDGFQPKLAATGDPQKLIRASIAEFWGKMSTTSFAVNGLAITSDIPYAPERIFGSLTRCILEFDRAFIQESEIDLESATVISDLQSVSYAREILVTVLRTKEQQDVLYAVNDLLRNDDLVVLSAKEEHEMVHLEVSFAGEDWNDSTESEEAGDEKTIWLHTKKKNSPTSRWARRYAVLSGVVLSYYEAANPRPKGLRGQLVLNRSSQVKIVEVEAGKGAEGESHVLLVSTKEEERYLLFENETEMTEWKKAIERAIDAPEGTFSAGAVTQEHQKQISVEDGVKKSKTDVAVVDADITGEHSSGKQSRPSKALRIPGSIVKSARSGGESSVKTAKDGGRKLFRGAQKSLFRHRRRGSSEAPSAAEGKPVSIPRRPSVDVLFDHTRQQGKREPTVQCVAQHLHRFVVGDRFESDQSSGNGLFVVHAKLFQAFMLHGGPNGKLSRGKPLVEIDIKDSAMGLLGDDERFDKLLMFI